jgi:hypothetical protein
MVGIITVVDSQYYEELEKRSLNAISVLYWKLLINLILELSDKYGYTVYIM